MKAFVGRADAPPPAIGDRELATAAHRELVLALGLGRPPVDVRGPGVAACLRSGRAAADQILRQLSGTADKPVRSFA